MLAVAVHGMSKDLLDSQDARQHRRTVCLGRGMAAVLAVLLAVSGTVALVAGKQCHAGTR